MGLGAMALLCRWQGEERRQRPKPSVIRQGRNCHYSTTITSTTTTISRGMSNTPGSTANTSPVNNNISEPTSTLPSATESCVPLDPSHAIPKKRIPLDVIFMVINAIVAGAVIGVGFFLKNIPEKPIYGHLNAEATSIATAKRTAFLLSMIAGT